MFKKILHETAGLNLTKHGRLKQSRNRAAIDRTHLLNEQNNRPIILLNLGEKLQNIFCDFKE